MKKILISVLTFLSMYTFASNDASLILEYNYTNESEQISLKHLESDEEFCCYFVIENKKNTNIQSDIIKVLDKKSGVCLGVLYGIPNKEFLMRLYSNVLSPVNVQDIVEHTLVKN